mmetsp:Transcript_7896/g.28835  ORF Transcript_7896/g.28835 Transcript_7896/m.28835 type:complete len:214 (-) Transcript_7896:722-1363(-)
MWRSVCASAALVVGGRTRTRGDGPPHASRDVRRGDRGASRDGRRANGGGRGPDAVTAGALGVLLLRRPRALPRVPPRRRLTMPPPGLDARPRRRGRRRARARVDRPRGPLHHRALAHRGAARDVPVGSRVRDPRPRRRGRRARARGARRAPGLHPAAGVGGDAARHDRMRAERAARRRGGGVGGGDGVRRVLRDVDGGAADAARTVRGGHDGG